MAGRIAEPLRPTIRDRWYPAYSSISLCRYTGLTCRKPSSIKLYLDSFAPTREQIGRSETHYGRERTDTGRHKTAKTQRLCMH
jgi:hypothetical protein